MLRLRFGDYTRATRSHTLPGATADTAAALAALRGLLAAAGDLIAERGITLIGVTLTNLDADDAVQLELPFDRHDARGLDTVLDSVRDRYGTASITRGVLLRVDLGESVPLLRE